VEPIEYERMDAAEERLWWYRALHAQLLDALGRSPLPAGAAILDAGCGTGGLLKRLAAIAPGRPRVGLDREATAAHRAACKSDASIVIGSVDALPFADASFGADMLYHRDVDPSRAASEAYRCLMPEGMIVVNRPAFGWLASYHDRQVHGARRYDPRTGACAAGTGRRPRAQTARVAAVLADQCSVRRGHADRTPRDEMGAALSGRRLGPRGGAPMSAPGVLPARVALSFVVPVYRGARTVGPVVDAIAQLRIEGGVEVVLVNDGSPDDSGAVCCTLTRRTDVAVTLVDLAKNAGEHNAAITGLRHTRGAYVVTIDDDRQRALALGASEHIVKPADREEIAAAVLRLSERERAVAA
jgi:ubiquinone/menaquinone biosynthesis C-methylase UbiE/CheY-like chemotaxis protein